MWLTLLLVCIFTTPIPPRRARTLLCLLFCPHAPPRAHTTRNRKNERNTARIKARARGQPLHITLVVVVVVVYTRTHNIAHSDQKIPPKAKRRKTGKKGWWNGWWGACDNVACAAYLKPKHFASRWAVQRDRADWWRSDKTVAQKTHTHKHKHTTTTEDNSTAARRASKRAQRRRNIKVGCAGGKNGGGRGWIIYPENVLFDKVRICFRALAHVTHSSNCRAGCPCMRIGVSHPQSRRMMRELTLGGTMRYVSTLWSARYDSRPAPPPGSTSNLSPR